MRVVNVMFGKGLGGIEQAFIDYCKALIIEDNEVIGLIQPDAEIEPVLAKAISPAKIEIKKIRNHGQWDPLAVIRIRSFLKKEKPDIVITHGVRAAVLMKKSARGICPVIGLAHNYSTGNLVGLDAIFCITRDLLKKVVAEGQPPNRVFHIPNMVDVPKQISIAALRNPPVIGTIGRFVKKKGFDIFLHALAELRKRNFAFRAVLGGSGEEEASLKALCRQLELDDIVTMPGWIQDKDEFYRSIDVFCLPSLHEPFGIVLLEAFARGKAVVTTDSEGPSEIATQNNDAIIVPKGDYQAMANALLELIINPSLPLKLAENAYHTVGKNYSLPVVANKIQRTLLRIIG